MPNVYQKSAIVAKEALLRLNNALVLGNLVYRDYTKEFQRIGNTVGIKSPSTFTAVEWGGSTVTPQYINETGQSLVLNKVPDITIPVTSIDWTLNIEDWSEQVMKPVGDAMAQYVDQLIASVYYQGCWTYPVTGTTTIQDFADLDKVMNDNKVPNDNRNLVMSTALKSKFITLSSIMNAEKSGSTDALRRASLGQIMGFDTYMSQNIKTHTQGTIASGNASGTAGAPTIAVSSANGATVTFATGDVFTIAGDTQEYVVTTGQACSGSAISALAIAPVLATSPSNAAITVKVTAGKNSMAFHKNAIALVTSSLAPAEGAPSHVESMNGLSVRVTTVYNADTKTDQYSFDMLCGCKVIDPRLMVRYVG